MRLPVMNANTSFSLTDMTASVVGRANAQAASRRLFAVFNNQRLNAHMAFKILDVIIDVLFPEFANTLNP